jgi:uncharacterized alkaline shock family protein YloU
MTIARKAALAVPGVKAVGRPATGRSLASGGRLGAGARLVVHDGLITGDMFLVIRAGVNVREVCREVQNQAARALQEMAGMTVARLDIHVEDIAYEGAEA